MTFLPQTSKQTTIDSIGWDVFYINNTLKIFNGNKNKPNGGWVVCVLQTLPSMQCLKAFVFLDMVLYSSGLCQGLSPWTDVFVQQKWNRGSKTKLWGHMCTIGSLHNKHPHRLWCPSNRVENKTTDTLERDRAGGLWEKHVRSWTASSNEVGPIRMRWDEKHKCPCAVSSSVWSSCRGQKCAVETAFRENNRNLQRNHTHHAGMNTTDLLICF